MFRGIEAVRHLNKLFLLGFFDHSLGSCKCSFSSQNHAWGFCGRKDRYIGTCELVLKRQLDALMNAIAIRCLRRLCGLLLVTPFEHLLKLVLIPIQQVSS
jgi:hypothetical protein